MTTVCDTFTEPETTSSFPKEFDFRYTSYEGKSISLQKNVFLDISRMSTGKYLIWVTILECPKIDVGEVTRLERAFFAGRWDDFSI